MGNSAGDGEDPMAKQREEDQGALALALDLAMAFKRVSLLVVVGLGDPFGFPRKVLRVLCGYFEQQR